MRKYGKWVLSLSLMAATPGLTSAADPQSMGANLSRGVRASKVDNQRMAESIANALRDKVTGGDIGIEYKDGVVVLSGSVADTRMKKLATSLTEQVPNVVRVDNRMTVAEKNGLSWIGLSVDQRRATSSKPDSPMTDLTDSGSNK